MGSSMTTEQMESQIQVQQTFRASNITDTHHRTDNIAAVSTGSLYGLKITNIISDSVGR